MLERDYYLPSLALASATFLKSVARASLPGLFVLSEDAQFAVSIFCGAELVAGDIGS